MRFGAAVWLLILAQAAAGESRAHLDDTGVFADLTGARQDAQACGRTFFIHGQPFWGHWRMKNAHSCSQSLPKEAWACVDDFADAAGGLRFGYDFDHRFAGQLAE